MPNTLCIPMSSRVNSGCFVDSKSRPLRQMFSRYTLVVGLKSMLHASMINASLRFSHPKARVGLLLNEQSLLVVIATWHAAVVIHMLTSI